MKRKDVDYWRTAEGLDAGAMQEALYRSKRFTIIGCVVIFIGIGLQIAALFV